MNKTIKKTGFAAAIFVLALIVLAATVVAVPQTAYAAPDVDLPFTLVAPQNVVLTKENIGDSATTLGMAYSMSNEINAFFVAYHDSGDESAYLASRGITAYNEIYLGIQIDWALDDVNDAVSGWHHNAYWDDAPLGTLGTDEDGKQQFSEWDVVDCGLYDTQIVNDIWLYRGMNAGLWNGSENWVGVKEQLRPSQYTANEHDEEVDLSIDWNQHTMYSRVRFVVTTYNDETNETEHTFSDWSAVAAYGKDAEKVEPLKPGDVVAPTITGLRMTEEKFNDNPVVAFTLTVPETVAEQKARVAAANGTFRVEVEARVKGTSEWKDLNVAGDVTTGELTAALLYLAEPGKPVAAGTEIELRARYFVEQAGQDGFYSAYSKVIGFGSDDIVYNEAPVVNGGGAVQGDGAEGTHKCKICHICPEPLGLCIFIWLALIVAVAIVVFVVIKVLKKAKEKKDEDKNNE